MQRSNSITARICLGFLLGAIVAMTAAAADDLAARRKALEPYFRMYRPDGSGPIPAVLFVSGCLGFGPTTAPRSYTSLAEDWKAKGYAVVFVDYLAARGTDRCSGTTTEDVGKDVLAVASYLRTQPFIDPKRISAIGWSLGGGGVLDTLGQMDRSDDLLTRREEPV